MKNLMIKQYATAHRVKLWQVAEALGIHPATLSVRLRHELSTEEKNRIFAIIDELSEGAR